MPAIMSVSSAINNHVMAVCLMAMNAIKKSRALRAHTPHTPCITIIVQLRYMHAVDNLHLHVQGQLYT